MYNNIESKLEEMGLSLQEAPAPIQNYIGHTQVGNIVYVSGQLPIDKNGLVEGKVGETLSIDDGVLAARKCALNILSQVKRACSGDLNKVSRIVKITGFVNSAPDFTDQPKVINGASDLFVDIFGDSGRHTRSAVGASALPLGAAVEIEAIIEVHE